MKSPLTQIRFYSTLAHIKFATRKNMYQDIEKKLRFTYVCNNPINVLMYVM